MKKIIPRNLFILSLGVMTLLGIQACSCDIHCTKAIININYVGYDSLTLDTVIVRRFDKTISGNRLKDTILLTSPEQIRYRFIGDTALLGSGANPGMLPFFSLESKWNYEVFIPAAGDSFQISDILEEQTSRDVPCFACAMQTRICMNIINGITVNNRPASVDGYRIFLSK